MCVCEHACMCLDVHVCMHVYVCLRVCEPGTQESSVPCPLAPPTSMWFLAQAATGQAECPLAVLLPGPFGSCCS